MGVGIFFFFSSRRRHTRCSRDWSSDVCSSDLAAGTQWTLFLPERDYPEPDSVSYENQGRDVLFPHRLPMDSGQAALAFIATPTMDSLTLAFALEGVRALQLGGRSATDLLAVSLSTTDYVGHAYGPHSREIHDPAVRP